MNLNSLTGDCPFAVDFTVDSTYFGFEYDGEDGELVE